MPDFLNIDDSIPNQIKAKGDSQLSRAKSVKEQLKTLKEAKSRGLNINKDVTVEDAKNYLKQLPEGGGEMERVKKEIGGVEYFMPKEVVESEAFKNMDDDYKAMAAYSQQALFDQGQDIEKVINAWDVAVEQSDSFMKQEMRLFEDSLRRTFTNFSEDYESQEQVYSQRIDEIKEDLRTSKEDLSLDEQRKMKEIQKEYEKSLKNTRENMEQSGLTRSSIRSRAEQMVEESKKDVIESTETQYDRQRRDNRLKARRGIQDIQQQQEQFQRQSERKATEQLRKGEEYMGSDMFKQKLPELGIEVDTADWMPEDWMVGDIRSEHKQAGLQDTLSRQGLFNQQGFQNNN